MITFDRCRRAACVVLVVAFLVMVPSMATAKFTATQAPTLSVSTDTMQLPSSVHGSFTCSSPYGNEAISLSISSFTDAGPAGSTYTYSLLRGSVTKSTGTSTTHAKTLTGSQPDDGSSTTWSITIRAGLAHWTGPVFTKTVTCDRYSSTTGTF